ncbi:hypothetical protein LTR86_009865 [Recurvomyces mirabilis]|nr:hypothetical protein LTR86_009865 [Recurvomyces mirabilis]
MGSTKCSDERSLLQLATDLIKECTYLEGHYETNTFFSSADSTHKLGGQAEEREAGAARSNALGLIEQLSHHLRGPHDYLHDFVASNWDHGALYAVLQHGILEEIQKSGGLASVPDLALKCGIPEDKLIRILGLLRCKNIVCQPDHNYFALTPISMELLEDTDFRAWVEFQLFETRVASAHLADALLRKPNTYATGSSGFREGWGLEMYDWHARHADKGERFRRAMRGVSKSLDPADTLLHEWFSHAGTVSGRIVELGGRYGFAYLKLAQRHESLSIEVRCEMLDSIKRAESQSVESTTTSLTTFEHVSSLCDSQHVDNKHDVRTYILRNLLWNWSDEDAIRLLQSCIPALEVEPATGRILVIDGVSPEPGQLPAHEEIAYRRRDITTMTMHNVKQRSQAEWLKVFSRVDPALKVSSITWSGERFEADSHQVSTSFEYSSHVCKALWELRLSD